MVDVVVVFTPALPLVYADGLDVWLYHSVEAVERSLEPWDVRNDKRILDATGRRARFDVVVEPSAFAVFERVRFLGVDPTPVYAGELRTSLFEYLKHMADKEGSEQLKAKLIENPGLDQLIVLASSIAPQE